jgi:nucleotide-binding universal stress UspA family protein
MTHTSTGPVVVGVDFSTPSDNALEYAAWEAERQHRTLAVLHGYDAAISGVPPITGYHVAMRHGAERRLAEVVELVQKLHPDLTISSAVHQGSGARTLVHASHTAALVVVSSHGHGRLHQTFVGSVASQVSSHAACPVVVVRPTASETAEGPVLVGVDGSDYSLDAVDFAFGEASRREQPLVAASVWGLGDLSELSRETPWGEDASAWQRRMEADSDRMLSEALAGRAEQHPQVEVRHLTVDAVNAWHGLIATAEAVGAALTVVGSRGAGGFSGLLLGSVSQNLISHASGDVAIVR